MPNSILKKKLQEIEHTGSLIGAPDWLIEELTNPKHVFKMQFRATVGGQLKLLTITRIHHRNPYPTGVQPFKGGIRYHPGANEKLLTVLAMDMTEKCALAGLHFGGAKGGIAFDPTPCSELELRRITEQMTMELLKVNLPHPDIDVPGPDVGTNPTVMYWMYNKIAETNHYRNISDVAATVTGKPVEHNGVHGRENATSHGLLIQLKEFLRISKMKLGSRPTVAIQGFGNVGSNIALLTQDERFNFLNVVAVSDRQTGLYSSQGLDVISIKKWYDKNGTLAGFPSADKISNQELLELPVDILVPAAIENQITKENALRIKAPLISEGANEAITTEANNMLADRGTTVIPGIVANVGGVVVSYFEWRKNRGERKHKVDFKEEEEWVQKKLTDIMHGVIHDVYTKSEEKKCSIPQAAHMLAMEIMRGELRMKHSYTN
ncbi:glutamate dehydrogenase [bacterium]|nr:glutamate dehydrogenase [bacterium]|tara:strand:+ start:25373 stop:26677 length:1305 start_codon:yes stop_codon:yes gene_type:complete